MCVLLYACVGYYQESKIRVEDPCDSQWGHRKSSRRFGLLGIHEGRRGDVIGTLAYPNK